MQLENKYQIQLSKYITLKKRYQPNKYLFEKIYQSQSRNENFRLIATTYTFPRK